MQQQGSATADQVLELSCSCPQLPPRGALQLAWYSATEGVLASSPRSRLQLRSAVGPGLTLCHCRPPAMQRHLRGNQDGRRHSRIQLWRHHNTGLGPPAATADRQRGSSLQLELLSKSSKDNLRRRPPSDHRILPFVWFATSNFKVSTRILHHKLSGVFVLSSRLCWGLAAG